MRDCLFVAMIGSLIVASAPAAGFVRFYTTNGCHPVYWDPRCIHLTTDSAGVPEMPIADFDRIVQSSIDSWQRSTSGSRFLRLDYLPTSIPREVAACDGMQVIKFRVDSWCRPIDGCKNSQMVCYDPAAAALTTVTHVDEPTDPVADGRIVDADIDLNAVNNYFYDADKGPPPVSDGRQRADLWNTLTHELGHLQGLDHTCRRGTLDTMPTCTRDGHGNQVIDCQTVEAGRFTDNTLASIYDTTMYPTAQPEETKKRLPKADDIAAIIERYPLRNDPR